MRTTLKDILKHLVVAPLATLSAGFFISLGFWVLITVLTWLAKYPLNWIVGEETALIFAKAVFTDKAYGVIYALVSTLLLLENLLMMLIRDYIFLTKLKIYQMIHEKIHVALFGK